MDRNLIHLQKLPYFLYGGLQQGLCIQGAGKARRHIAQRLLPPCQLPGLFQQTHVLDSQRHLIGHGLDESNLVRRPPPTALRLL